MFVADYILLFFIQILVRSGSWGTLTSVEIRDLIIDCLHSRASSTVAKYIREVRKFINFQEINSRPLMFPANVAHLAYIFQRFFTRILKPLFFLHTLL